MNSQTQSIDVDKLFCELSVNKIEEHLKSLRANITEKKEQLRCLVSEKYRNIIDAADGIAQMKESSLRYKNIVHELNNEKISIFPSALDINEKRLTVLDKGLLCKFIIDSPLKIYENLKSVNLVGAAKVFSLSAKILDYVSENADTFSDVPKFSKIVAYSQYLKNMDNLIVSRAKTIIAGFNETSETIGNSVCAVSYLNRYDLQTCVSEFLNIRFDGLQQFLVRGDDIVVLLHYFYRSTVHFNELFSNVNKAARLHSIYDNCTPSSDDRIYINVRSIISRLTAFSDTLNLGDTENLKELFDSWAKRCHVLIYNGIKQKAYNAADLNELTKLCSLFDQQNVVSLTWNDDLADAFIKRSYFLLIEVWTKALNEIERTCNFDDNAYNDWIWKQTDLWSNHFAPHQAFQICKFLVDAFGIIIHNMQLFNRYVRIALDAEFEKCFLSLINKWFSMKHNATIFHLFRLLSNYPHVYGLMNMTVEYQRQLMMKAFCNYFDNEINQCNMLISINPLSSIWLENSDLLIPMHVSNDLLSRIFNFNCRLNKTFANTLDASCLADIIETYLYSLKISDVQQQKGSSFYLQKLFDLLLLNSVFQKHSLTEQIEETKSCIDAVDLHAVYPLLVERVNLAHQQLSLFFGNFSPVSLIPDTSSNSLCLCPCTVQFEPLPPAFTTMK